MLPCIAMPEALTSGSTSRPIGGAMGSAVAALTASMDILSGRPVGTAIRCPRNRGSSNETTGVTAKYNVLGELTLGVATDT